MSFLQPQRSILPRHTRRIGIITLFVSVCLSAGFGARAWKATAPKPEPPKIVTSALVTPDSAAAPAHEPTDSIAPDAESGATPKAPAAVPLQQDNQVEPLKISLGQFGFYPREITRPAGRYFLSLVNFSGKPELKLRLARENGNILGEAQVKRQKPYWRRQVNVPPGVYLLTETDNPGWVCRITITAR